MSEIARTLCAKLYLRHPGYYWNGAILTIMARQRLPHFSRRGRFGAMVAQHAHRFFDHFEVARCRAERGILEADANMAATRDRLDVVLVSVKLTLPGSRSANSSRPRSASASIQTLCMMKLPSKRRRRAG
jgi:hypothetical protein